jgi:hypothetical protein
MPLLNTWNNTLTLSQPHKCKKNRSILFSLLTQLGQGVIIFLDMKNTMLKHFATGKYLSLSDLHKKMSKYTFGEIAACVKELIAESKVRESSNAIYVINK